MAIQTENSARAGNSTKVTSYVNQQLEVARRGVKSTDLIGGILALSAIAISFLILAAIWDGWILPLTVFGRWVALGMMLSICIVFAVLRIAPLLLKRINPQYAARMIEQASPTFKNSLLNYVTLRKKEDEVNPVVFQAVSRQAAEDLATVPSGSTVDRSKLIFWGFVLVGLAMFTVGYKVISPKDPLQSIVRVLFPSAKIAQPARVDISEINPGDTRIFFGEQLNVTAIVRGKHSPEDVHLMISTLDGQTVNQRVSMEAEDAPGRYRVTLGKNTGGLQQSFNYQVVARDGLSPIYEVKVQSNPTIAIETLHLFPPRYTKAPKQTITGRGEVDALEGTKVEVEAIANLPIKEAHLDLLVFKESENPNRNNNFQVLRSIPMEVEGSKAKANFWALLNPAKDKSLASHYQLRFVSTTDDRNQKPNVYPIKVTPDLAPEIRVLRPANLEVTVAENGSMVFEVEANDLDYEISELTVHLNHRAVNTLQQRVETQPVGNGQQRVKGRFVLQPKQVGLREGDKAILFFTAADNRTAPGEQDRPDPNVSRSDNYTINVTAAEAQPKEPLDQQQNPQQSQANDPNQKNQEQDPANQKQQPKMDSPNKKDPAESNQKESRPQEDSSSENSADQSNPTSEQPDGQNPENGNSEKQPDSSGNESTENSAENEGQNPNNDEPQNKSEQGNEGSKESEKKNGSESQGSDKGSESKGSQSEKGNDSSTGSQASSKSNQSADGNDQGDSKSQGASKGQKQQPGKQSGSKSGKNGEQTEGAGDEREGGEAQPDDGQSQNSQPQGKNSGGKQGSKGKGQPSESNQGGSENPSDGNQAESRDNSLDSGKRSPLSKDAPQSEQMRRLDEMLNDKKDSQKNEESQNSTKDSNGSDQKDQDNSQKNDSGNGRTEKGSDSQTGRENESNKDSEKSDQGKEAAGNQDKKGSGNQDEKGSGNQDEKGSGNQDEKGSGNQANSERGKQESKNQSQPSKQGSNSKKNSGDKSPDKAEDKSSGDSESSKENSDSNSRGNEQNGSDQDKKSQSSSSDPKTKSGAGNKKEASSNEGSKKEAEAGTEKNDKGDPSQAESGDQGEQGSSGSPSESEKESGEKGGNKDSESQPEDSNSQENSRSKDGSKPSQKSESSENSSGGNEKSKQEPGSGAKAGEQKSEKSSQNSGSKSASDSNEKGTGDGKSSGGSAKNGAPGKGAPNAAGAPSLSAESSSGGKGSGPQFDIEKEKVNLDHAKKATDLILKRLHEQRYDPDPKLLEEMNWSQEDLNQFLDRWEEMKNAAGTGDEKAQRRYEQSLKSLDFRANSTKRKVGQSNEEVKGLNQDSEVVQPPPEFAPDFNATLRDLNKNDGR